MDPILMSADMYKRGLLLKAKLDFCVPVATELGRPVVYRQFGRIPLVSWPNRSACFEANCWVEDARSKGLLPNTICEYAYQAIPILKYAFANSLQLYEFDEYHFVAFMNQLKQEKHTHSPKSNSRERIGVIGRKCLDLLYFVGSLYNLQNYISETGAIQATRKKTLIRTPTGNKTVEIWHHPSVPVVKKTASIKNKILAPNSLNDLKLAARSSKSSSYVKSRQRVSIEVLQETGARREEVAPLTVKSVRDAATIRPVSLLLKTSKKGGIYERLVEISPSLLLLLQDYIEYDLTPMLNNKKLNLTDSSPLFASIKTGNAIQPNTITSEFLVFKRLAGIDGAVNPHQLRHLSITNDRIKHFEAHPADEAISRVIGLKGVPDFALRSMEKHGHASIQSQIPYNHYETVKDSDRIIKTSDFHSDSALKANLETAREIVDKGKVSKKDTVRLKKILDETYLILDKIQQASNAE